MEINGFVEENVRIALYFSPFLVHQIFQGRGDGGVLAFKGCSGLTPMGLFVIRVVLSWWVGCSLYKGLKSSLLSGF